MSAPDWLAGRPGHPQGIVLQQVLQAADITLRQSLRGRHDLAAVTLRQADLSLDVGAAAMVRAAMLCWCDTAIAALGITVQHTAAVADGHAHMTLRFGTHRDGAVIVDDLGADDVPPAAAWAGRLFTARAAGDRDTALALLDTVPDADALGEAAAALLSLVCASMQTGQRLRIDAAAAERLGQ